MLRPGCGLHLLLLGLAVAGSCSFALQSARRGATLEAERGDSMDEMPVVVLVEDRPPEVIPFRVARDLFGDPGVSFLVPEDGVERVAAQAGVRLTLTALGAGRQSVRLSVESAQAQTEALYEADAGRVVPRRHVRPYGPDSMGLLWPLLVPFAYAGLWLASIPIRRAVRQLRPPRHS